MTYRGTSDGNDGEQNEPVLHKACPTVEKKKKEFPSLKKATKYNFTDPTRDMERL